MKICPESGRESLDVPTPVPNESKGLETRSSRPPPEDIHPWELGPGLVLSQAGFCRMASFLFFLFSRKDKRQ